MNDLLLTLLGDAGLDAISEWARPLAYFLAALVSLLLATSRSQELRIPACQRQAWLLLCPLYLLASANSLVQGDVLWVEWARGFAHQHHLYEERRAFQLLTLLALAVAAVCIWNGYKRRALNWSAHPSVLNSMLLAGGSGTLGLLLLRYVSFHYTDLVLNAHILHHSFASWMEVTSLGLAALASGLEWLRSYGHV